jgi:hypothetical protein
MRKLLYQTVKHCVRAAIRLRLHFPLVWFISKKIQTVKPSNGRQTDPSKPRVLAINEHYFIKDLEILADSGEFNVLKIPIKWQSMLLRLYWTDKTWDYNNCRQSNLAYYKPSDPAMIKMQDELRKTLAIFLRSLFDYMDIKCLLSANFTYVVDYDWMLTAHSIGTPAVVFHKENLTLSKALEDFWIESLEDLGSFRATKVFLHNEKMKSLLIQTGFADESQVKVLGCLRMDGYIKRLRDADAAPPSRKNRVTLFSFQKNAGLEMLINDYFGDKGYVKFFEHVHTEFAKAAVRHPDTEFVIKPKYGRDWFEAIEKVMNDNGLFSKDIPNLKMTVDISAQDLIMESDVVCSFASTTILEAAVAGKPVIIPHFDEALKPEYQPNIILKDYYWLFDTAETPEDFGNRIDSRLENPLPGADYIAEARKLFSSYVSSFEGGSAPRYIAELKHVIGVR